MIGLAITALQMRVALGEDPETAAREVGEAYSRAWDSVTEDHERYQRSAEADRISRNRLFITIGGVAAIWAGAMVGILSIFAG